MREIKNNLEMDFMILNKWFHKSHMWLNPGKCNYFVISDDDRTRKIILNNIEIASSNEEKRLGILLDSKLKFYSHITGQKFSALARINHYLTQDQILLLCSKISIQLLPTDLDVFVSIFKQCIKQHSRKSLTFNLQRSRSPF